MEHHGNEVYMNKYISNNSNMRKRDDQRIDNPSNRDSQIGIHGKCKTSELIRSKQYRHSSGVIKSIRVKRDDEAIAKFRELTDINKILRKD